MVSRTFFLFGASLLRIGTSSVAPIKTQMSGSCLGLRGQDVVGEKRTSASPDSVVAHGSFRFQFRSFAMLRLAKGKLKLTSIQGMRREFNGRYWVEYTNTYVFAVESSSRPLAATLHVALGWEYILLVPVYIGLWFITPTSSTIRRHTLALATCTGHEKVFPATPSSRATTTVNCGWHSINTLSNDLREAPLMVGRSVGWSVGRRGRRGCLKWTMGEFNYLRLPSKLALYSPFAGSVAWTVIDWSLYRFVHMSIDGWMAELKCPRLPSLVPCSVPVRVSGRRSGVTASARIATRTGSSRATPPAGSVACTPTGPSWRAASTRSWTRTRERRQSDATFTSLCWGSPLRGTSASSGTCRGAPPGRTHGTGAWGDRRHPRSCPRATQVSGWDGGGGGRRSGWGNDRREGKEMKYYGQYWMWVKIGTEQTPLRDKMLHE